MRSSTALTLRSPGDLLATVPHLLGFHPSASLVAICLRERRLGLLARVDLPPPGDAASVLASLMPAVAADAPDAALLIGYENDDGQSLVTLNAVADALAPLDIRVMGKLVVHQGGGGPSTAPTPTAAHLTGHRSPDPSRSH